MGNKVSKKKEESEHHYVEIIEPKDTEEPLINNSPHDTITLQRRMPLSRRELKIQQLKKQQSVERVHRMELWQLSIDEFIVHGYVRNIRSQTKEEIPIDILTLIMKGVGPHYSNIKIKESCSEIIEHICKEPDPMISYHNVFANCRNAS